MNSRKKMLIVAGAILVIFGVWFFFFKNNESEIINRNSRGTSIVAFGDSLINGVGSTEGSDFVSLLSERIDQPIINLGVNGNTTVDGLARINKALDEDPKIVILLLGGNDYLKKVPIDETFKNLELMVKAIQKQGSMVLLLGVRGGLLTDIFAERFEEFAASHGVAFVPNVLDGLIAKNKYMSDAVHPNDAGYEKIADKVEPTLRRLLK
ncbi:MAG: acyl-CoA thioesterase [Patescibacteria group bacterium]|nr:acyl-CoA thioesterase [Patescibacteria group bacterium]